LNDPFFRALAREAAARYPARDRFARHFAYGKLTRDPVFAHMLDGGLIADGTSVLDLGCGQGLLAALLATAQAKHEAGLWPARRRVPPRTRSLIGIDLSPRACERARSALPQARWMCADLRGAELPYAGTIVMLDVLHYLEAPAQESLLERVRAALEPGGVLLLRVADARPSWRLSATLAADRLTAWIRGRGGGRIHVRPLDEWRNLLERHGLRVGAVPMSAGTPFANVLLEARAPSTIPC
jgi:SAM-dependent methyltransferase